MSEVTDEKSSGFSYLDAFSEIMGHDSKEILGRDEELKNLDATMERPEMNNLLLLAPPGAGKTAIVEYWASKKVDTATTYAIDLVSMGGQGEQKFAERIKAMIDEVIEISNTAEKDIVLFIDEVHMLGMDNYAVGLEALKPAMARGKIKLIGATTDEEYVQYIQPNQALNQRFQRFDIAPPRLDVVRRILQNIWSRSTSAPVDMKLIDTIIDYGRFFPSDAQPRKSIKILDDMLGWHRSQGYAMDKTLLNTRIQESSGVNPELKLDIENVQSVMERRVQGQPYALDAINGTLNIAVANIGDKTRPRGSFIFTGSTGVGKTELAKAMAEGLFEDEDAMIRFDMSEYLTRESMDTFRERLADAITKRPFSVVLLDEIEKADPSLIDMLLQITDDGRLSDRYGRQTTFKNAYIIMTTNIGHEIFDTINQQGMDVTKELALISERIAKQTKPEFLGRIDAIVPFAPLGLEVREMIATHSLSSFARMLAHEKGIKLTLSKRVMVYLAKEGVSMSTSGGGGRDLKRKIKNELHVLVARTLNKIPNLSELRIDVYGEMSAEDKQRVESTAELGVVEYQTRRSDGYYDYFYGDVRRGIDAFDEDRRSYMKVDETGNRV